MHPQDSGTVTSGSTGARKARRYGFACTPCKSRKVKCSGEQPTCAGCLRSGDECVWPANPKSNDARLSREENDIAVSQLAPQEQPPVPNSSDGTNEVRALHGNESSRTVTQVSTAPVRDALDLQRPAAPSVRTAATPIANTPASTAGTDKQSRRASSTASRYRPLSGSNADPSLWYQVGISGDGTVSYNGPTSRFHAGSFIEANENDSGNESDGQDAKAVGNDRLSESSTASPKFPAPTYDAAAGHLAILRSQYDLMDSVWIPLVTAKPTMNGTGVDTSTGLALLEIYWIWLHPLHHLVYRPAFTMDLALGGPHCSDFLLLCIFALAARHLPSEENDRSMEGDISRGEQYVKRAKSLLLDDGGFFACHTNNTRTANPRGASMRHRPER